ncbi:uncharacterized protein [Watersipora subatra]|uniref:uncharacterized protein n=1 Tax=Watersipora subatra TaxID=2589382 RepID=UPI00355B812A
MSGDSGLITDFSDDSRRGTECSMETPDTGLGIEIARLSSPKKHFDLLYGDSDSSPSANQTGYSYVRPSSAIERNSQSETEEKRKLPTTESQIKEESVEKINDLSWQSGKPARSSSSHSRSHSLQLDAASFKEASLRNPAINRRASSYAPSRNLSDFPAAEDIGTTEMEDRMKARNRNNDGVQLRGDKGNARKKSAMSIASSQVQKLPITNEWRKPFEVPYAPRQKPTKIVRATIAPPKIGILDSDKGLDSVLKPDSSRNERSWRQSHRLMRRQNTSSASDTESAGHAEIHYEKYLPKESWLEMKPRRFTHNYKHGNHFELRKSSSKLKNESQITKSNLRKETFIWENPHQIWLMEKTRVD